MEEGGSGPTYIEGLRILEAVAAGQPAADKRLVGLAGTEGRGGGGSRGRRRGCVVGRGAVGARRRRVRRSVGFALLGRHDRAFRRVLVVSSKGGGPCAQQRGLRWRVSRDFHVIVGKSHVGCCGEEDVIRALGFYSESGFVGPAFGWAVLAWGAERAVTRESEAAKADFFEGRRVDNKRDLSQRVRDEKVDCEGFLFGPK